MRIEELNEMQRQTGRSPDRFQKYICCKVHVSNDLLCWREMFPRVENRTNGIFDLHSNPKQAATLESVTKHQTEVADLGQTHQCSKQVLDLSQM